MMKHRTSVLLYWDAAFSVKKLFIMKEEFSQCYTSVFMYRKRLMLFLGVFSNSLSITLMPLSWA